MLQQYGGEHTLLYKKPKLLQCAINLDLLYKAKDKITFEMTFS